MAGCSALVRTRLRLAIFLGCVGAAVLGGAFWLLSAPDRGVASELDQRRGDAERGRLVFAAADCASCHASPGQADRLKLGGGLQLASPYGTLRVPNISQDPLDGIGRWRTSDLERAVRRGVSPDGHHYYPAFPYVSYCHLRTDDVVDLMAYLRSLPAVAGKAPPHELTFPFNLRRTIGLWNLLYLDQRAIDPDASRSAAWNRGRYLVAAAAHCAECHSSRNVLGAIKEATRFAGGHDSSGTGFVPNITAVGIGHWTEADVARMLADGRTPDLRTVGSSMAGVVENTRSLPDSDRRAIASYIKTLVGRPTPPP